MLKFDILLLLAYNKFVKKVDKEKGGIHHE